MTKHMKIKDLKKGSQRLPEEIRRMIYDKYMNVRIKPQRVVRAAAPNVLTAPFIHQGEAQWAHQKVQWSSDAIPGASWTLAFGRYNISKFEDIFRTVTVWLRVDRSDKLVMFISGDLMVVQDPSKWFKRNHRVTEKRVLRSLLREAVSGIRQKWHDDRGLPWWMVESLKESRVQVPTQLLLSNHESDTKTLTWDKLTKDLFKNILKTHPGWDAIDGGAIDDEHARFVAFLRDNIGMDAATIGAIVDQARPPQDPNRAGPSRPRRLVSEDVNAWIEAQGLSNAYAAFKASASKKRRAPDSPPKSSPKNKSPPRPCGICFTEPAVMPMDGCEHVFCMDCIAQYIKATQDEALLHPTNHLPICPQCKAVKANAGTSGVVSERELTSLVDGEYMTKAQRARLSRAMIRVATGGDVLECIRCAMPYTVNANVINDKTRTPFVTCPSCSVEQCARCIVPKAEHGTMTCDEFKVNNQKTDAKTQKILNQETIKCPGCGAPLMRNGGCAKLTCHCGKSSCALCGQAVDGYSHWNQQQGPCHGHLWTTKVDWLKLQNKKKKPKKK